MSSCQIAILALGAYAVLATVAALRGGVRRPRPTAPPTQLEQLLDDHRRDVPLRGPDPREEGER